LDLSTNPLGVRGPQVQIPWHTGNRGVGSPFLTSALDGGEW
jgi:hypothetical protein